MEYNGIRWYNLQLEINFKPGDFKKIQREMEMEINSKLPQSRDINTKINCKQKLTLILSLKYCLDIQKNI